MIAFAKVHVFIEYANFSWLIIKKRGASLEKKHLGFFFTELFSSGRQQALHRP